MHFTLSPEQRLLIETVQKFIARELALLEQEVEETGVLAPEKARAIFEKPRSLGFYALNIPQEFGGGGLSAVDTLLLWRNSLSTPATF